MTDPSSAAERSQEPLVARVMAWLSKEGYPFELRAARSLGRQGWKFDLSRTYADSLEGKSREIDIVASRTWSNMHSVSVDVDLVVECKTSGDSKPWIIFGPASDDWTGFYDYEEDLPHDIVPYDPLSGAALRASGACELEYRVLAVAPQQASTRMQPGTSIVEAFRKEGHNNAWNATRTVIGACQAFAAASATRWQEHREWTAEHRHITVSILVPLAVVEAPVFRCWITDDGKEHIEAVPWSPVTFDYPSESGAKRSYAVHVVAAEALNDFIAAITEDLEHLSDTLTATDDLAEKALEATAED